MENPFSDYRLGWLLILQLINFILPILVVGAVVSLLIVWLAVGRSTGGSSEPKFDFGAELSILFGFCVIGAVAGMVIYMVGALGRDGFSGLTTLASSFIAVASFYFGEQRISTGKFLRPLATSAATLMLFIGYHYYSLVMAASTGMSATMN